MVFKASEHTQCEKRGLQTEPWKSPIFRRWAKKEELTKKTDKEHPSRQAASWMVQYQWSQVKKCFKNDGVATSLGGQWLRIHLPIQGHGFDFWSKKIPLGAEQLSLCTPTTEPMSCKYLAHARGAWASQQEATTLRWGARAPQSKDRRHLPQLETAGAQPQDSAEPKIHFQKWCHQLC